jgi:glycosyltransferase involved in cell wall biosynthesis
VRSSAVQHEDLLEGTNGLTDRRLEGDLHALLAGVSEGVLTTLATRYELSRPTDGRHVLTAGSDDHGLRNGASCFMSSPRAGLDAAELLAAVARGEARCHGHQADLNVMHLTAERVTYGFLAARKDERPSYRDPFLDLVDVVAGRETAAHPPTGMRDELVRSLLAGAARTATPLGPEVDPHATDAFGDDADARVMAAIRGTHDGLIGRAFDELVDGIGDLDLYRAIGGVRDLLGALASATPFLFSAHHFGKQTRDAREVLARWDASPRPPRVRRLAIFSDSLEQVDGVTSSLRRFVRRAVADGFEVRVPYCGSLPPDDSSAGVYMPLPSASTRVTEIYAGMQFHLPSLLGTIDWLWRQDITNVELATPGPMGIVGLCAARLLGIPVTASYHTEVTELSRELSNNRFLHALSRQIVGWFYGAVDRVFAFSECSRAKLVALGVAPAKIELAAVAIDPAEFSPVHACPLIYPSFGLAGHEAPIVLSVGRLSREKNLPLVIEAFDRLRQLEHPPRLVIVGDGPEAEGLRSTCAHRPWVIFAGLQQGERLQRLYASASAFVFASRIDTLGLVTMEAMSSGLPVLVPKDAAIAELVKHGRTGYCYDLTADGLAAALAEVLASPHRAGVARNARAAMVERWARTRMTDVWQAMAGGS